MDIVELRYMALRCFLLSIRTDDLEQITRLHEKGLRYTAMADQACEAKESVRHNVVELV